MRQLEGGWLSNVALDRSKQRIQRLSYVKTVTFETTPVPGSADMVDVNFSVEEGPSAQLSRRHRLFGVAEIHPERQLRRCELPRQRRAGGGRAAGRPLQQGVLALADQSVRDHRWHSARRVIELSRHHAVHRQRLGAVIEDSAGRARVRLPPDRVPGVSLRRRFADFRTSHLLRRQRAAGHRLGAAERASVHRTPLYQNGITYYYYGTRFADVQLSTGWSFDTRNRTLFPTSGARHAISCSRRCRASM